LKKAPLGKEETGEISFWKYMVQYIIDMRDGRMQIAPRLDVVTGREGAMRSEVREKKGRGSHVGEKGHEVIMIRVLVPIFAIDE
jgi:hypothetical protein